MNRFKVRFTPEAEADLLRRFEIENRNIVSRL
jgi:hypothetical protein